MSEPERPIEKVLRECASKKRETAGADWKLHPVNRRQLHDEIGRTFGSPRARMTWFSWIQRMRWAKPVGALASVAILAAAAWLILDSSRAHKQMLIALNEAANRPLKEAKEQDRSKSQSAPLKKESELALQTPLEQSVIEKKDAEAEALPRSTESVVAQAAPPAMVRSEPQVRSFQAKTPQEASAGTAAMEGSTTPQSIAAAAYSARYGLARDATR